MSCCSCVFDVHVKFGVGGHEYTKITDAVFLFNDSPGLSMVYGFSFCFTISHQLEFVTSVVHVVSLCPVMQMLQLLLLGISPMSGIYHLPRPCGICERSYCCCHDCLIYVGHHDQKE